jgi:hypothetical protein
MATLISLPDPSAGSVLRITMVKPEHKRKLREVDCG